MTTEKPRPKQLPRQIATGAKSIKINITEFLAITCNLLKAREKSRAQGAIGLGFASHLLKNWRDIFKPIMRCCNTNCFVTLDSHLTASLKECVL